MQDVIPEINDVVQSGKDVSEKLALYHHQIVEVTIPIQCLVEEPSRLVLYEGSKSDLAGFFDPCFGKDDEKHLLIRYSYQGRVHQVIVRDKEQLRCPRVSHQLPNE